MRKGLLILAVAVLAMLQTAWAYDFSATSPSGHTLYYEIISGTTNVGVVRPGTDSTYDNYVTGNVVIPATVTYGGTTYNVTELRSVNNYGTFRNCSGLTSVTIGNSVTSIGNYAFGDCSGLTSVTIPNSVTSIGNYAFRNVRHIIYNGTATGSPWGAFSVNGYIEGDFVYANNTKTSLLAYIGTSTSVTIPNSVTSIGSSAFRNCSGLTSVTIPNSVTSIESSAFSNCSGLTSVTIPNSVTSIGSSAFYVVKNIIYNGTATGSPWGALSVNGDIEGDFVYANNTKTSLLAYIGTSTSVTIPNSVTTIGDRAFYGCSGLTSVTIPNSVTSIGSSAFSDCSGLTSVTIGNSVTSIGNSAFSGCNNLRDVTSLAVTPPTLGTTVFSVAGILKVPCGSLSAYRYSAWLDYFTIMEEICDNMTITVTSANESMGTVSGSGEYAFGTVATITAIPNEGYRFVSWNDGNTDNPRTITVTEDATYIASFEEGVGIESRDMLSELAFYPNPTSGIITFNRNDIIKVEVLDAMGKMVEVYENAYTIDISKLAKGYYAMRITTAEGVAVRKVIRK